MHPTIHPMKLTLAALCGLALLIAPPAFADAEIEKGKAAYTTYGCWTCHGQTGIGDGPGGANLDPPPRDFTKGDYKFGGSDKDIYEVIVNGAASKGGSPNMVPWGGVITDEAERQALVKFIRSLKK